MWMIIDQCEGYASINTISSRKDEYIFKHINIRFSMPLNLILVQRYYIAGVSIQNGVALVALPTRKWAKLCYINLIRDWCPFCCE